MMLKLAVTLILLGSLPLAGAFAPSASVSVRDHTSTRTRPQEVQRCPSRLFAGGFLKESRVLVRAADKWIRAYLPLFPDEVVEMVPIDTDAIKDSLESSDRVNVFRNTNFFRRTTFIGFEPKIDPKGIGFILYPGALVKGEAYAPLCRSLADMGYHAAICTPPYLASLVDINMADEPIRHFGDDVRLWTVSGHSMGGVAACSFANQCDEEYEDKLRGVVLLASYPSSLPGYTDGVLTHADYDIVSIYGSLDGLTTKPFVDLSKDFLGPKTKFVCIEGGNHSLFYYGTKLQLGDNEAMISRDEQQAITIKTICQLLDKIEAETGKSPSNQEAN